MANVTVYDLNKKSVGQIDLSDEVFGLEPNEDLLYEVLKAQLASKRVGSANTKIRSEVSATTKKMYKQKGTGSARHGNRAATQFRGGGRPKGPKPRSYEYRPPRKMRLGALKSALSLKLKEGRLLVVDSFKLGEIKTKNLAQVLTKLEASKSAIIVDAGTNENLRMSARNLPKHQVLPPEGVNLYDLLRHEHLILTREAVSALTERCTRVRGAEKED